jgi:hypothetical protein
MRDMIVPLGVFHLPSFLAVEIGLIVLGAAAEEMAP